MMKFVWHPYTNLDYKKDIHFPRKTHCRLIYFIESLLDRITTKATTTTQTQRKTKINVIDTSSTYLQRNPPRVTNRAVFEA
jgi:hypothetical protein